jgi:hypothetical protein
MKSAQFCGLSPGSRDQRTGLARQSAAVSLANVH